MDIKYRLIFQGFKVGISASDVRVDLGRLFDLPTESIQAMFSEPGQVVESGLTLDDAARLQKTIDGAGVICVVKPNREIAELPDLPLQRQAARSIPASEDLPQSASVGIHSSKTMKSTLALSRTAQIPTVKQELTSPGVQQDHAESAKTVAKTTNGGEGSRALLILAIVGTALLGIFFFLWLKSTNAPEFAQFLPGKSSDEYAQLTEFTIGYLPKLSNDLACDVIVSPGLTSVQKGKVVFIAMGGGKVDPPIPAIVARVTGTCEIKALRHRESMTQWWIMIAHDKSFERYDCIKVGGESLIRAFAQKGCEFLPNPGEQGLIPLEVPVTAAIQGGIAQDTPLPQDAVSTGNNSDAPVADPTHLPPTAAEQSTSSVSGNPQAPIETSSQAAAPQQATNPQAAVLAMIAGAKSGNNSVILSAKVTLDSFTKPERGDRKLSRARNILGLNALKENSYENAIARFIEAVIADPTDVEAKNNLGYAQMMAGRLDDAKETLVESLALDSARGAAWANLGQTFAKQGDEESAVAAFVNTFIFSRVQKKTLEFLTNLAQSDPDPKIRSAATRALRAPLLNQ